VLLEFLQSGGYPETVMKKLDPIQYLAILFDSIIFKDIIKRHKLRKGADIEQLAVFLLSNIGSDLSYLSLAKAVNIKSSLTAQKYCGFLEEAYLLFTISKFSYKTKQAGRSKKIYSYDNGMIAAKAFQSSPNWGKLVENCIAVHLKRKDLEKKLSVYFWRNPQGEEVDFVLKKGNQVTELIQACFSLENQKTRDREIRSLLKAGHELGCSKLTVLSLHEERMEECEWFGIKATINYMPIYKWLLDEN
jgi:predicted AAA+ superfamily ATPase